MDKRDVERFLAMDKNCNWRCCCDSTFLEEHYLEPFNINVLKHHFEQLREDVNQTSDTFDDNITSPLFITIKISGDLEMVKYLVARGANVNFQNYTNWTPFLLSVYEGKLDCADYLLHAGADPNACSYNGCNALMFASNIETYRFVLNRCSLNINAQDDQGNTALHWVYLKQTAKNKKECVQYLLTQGADPTVRNHDGDGVLQLAFLISDVSEIDFSLPNCNNIPYEIGQTLEIEERLLLLREHFKHHRRYKYIFSSYVKCLPHTPFFEESAQECLKLSIENENFGFDYGDKHLLKYLLKAPIETQMKCLEMLVPYLHANVTVWNVKPAYVGYPINDIICECVEMFCQCYDHFPKAIALSLLHKIIHLNPLIQENISIWHIFSILTLNPRIIEELIRFGMDVNVKDIAGYTPLLCICEQACNLGKDGREAQEILLKNGASADVPDCFGLTARDYSFSLRSAIPLAASQTIPPCSKELDTPLEKICIDVGLFPNNSMYLLRKAK